MHWYEIPSGTLSKLLVRTQSGQFDTKRWLTRKDLHFTETVSDPIRIEHHPTEYPKGTTIGDLARNGYAIFGGEIGSNGDANYLLAVPYHITQAYQDDAEY